jgi:hypothetical protein
MPVNANERKGRRASHGILLWTSWILTGTVASAIVVFPVFSALFDTWYAPPRPDWPKLVLMPFVALWMLAFAFNKLTGVLLLICALGVIASPKITIRAKFITAALDVLCCLILWFWASTIHF